jgi:hypothetical protein
MEPEGTLPFQKSPPLVTILSRMHPLHSFPPHFSKIVLILYSHQHLGLRSVLFPSGFPTEILCFYLSLSEDLGISLFTTASRPALGPTQSLVQWLPGAVFLGVKRPGCEADHSPSSAEVKNAWNYTSTPRVLLHWRGS